MNTNKLINDIIKNDYHLEICDKLNLEYHLTNYAVMLNDKIVCFTGSDIINARNVEDMLKEKYPDLEFYISEEFIELI